MAALAIPIAIGVSAAAAAGGSIYAGVQQSEAADYNAKVAKRQAQWEQMRAKAEADRLAERDKTLLSAQRARFAASGRDPAEESPLMALAESAATANVDYRSILQGGQMEADNLRSQADRYSAQGEDAIVAGGMGAFTALSGGATSFLGYQDARNYQRGQAAQEQSYQRQQMEMYTGNRGRVAPSAPGGYEWDW